MSHKGSYCELLHLLAIVDCCRFVSINHVKSWATMFRNKRSMSTLKYTISHFGGQNRGWIEITDGIGCFYLGCWRCNGQRRNSNTPIIYMDLLTEPPRWMSCSSIYEECLGTLVGGGWGGHSYLFSNVIGEGGGGGLIFLELTSWLTS